LEFSTIIFIIIIVLAADYFILRRLFSNKNNDIITHKGVVDRIREIGDLVALTAFYKDIATKRSNNKLLDLFGGKQMAVISEFDLEYRYDLHKTVITENNDKVHIKMPICTTKVVPVKLKSMMKNHLTFLVFLFH